MKLSVKSLVFSALITLSMSASALARLTPSSVRSVPASATNSSVPIPSESDASLKDRVIQVALSEKSDTTPTAWYWLHGVSVDQVKAKLSEGYRLIDIEVEQTSPYEFSTVMVKNQGAYAKSWWWYYGLTSDEVKSKLSQHNARIIDLEIYRVNGEKRYAVVLVPNTGSEAKSWWYYSDYSFDDLMAKVRSHNARIVDIDTYVINGQQRFSAVMIANQGADQKTWWVYSNVSANFIGDKLKENQARLVDIEQRNSDTFTVVMERSQGQAWWWYYGVTDARINELTRQNKARIIDIEPYIVGGNKRFLVLMLQN